MATGDPIMINRKLADIVKGQKLVALAERETVQQACRYMCERRPLITPWRPTKAWRYCQVEGAVSACRK